MFKLTSASRLPFFLLFLLLLFCFVLFLAFQDMISLCSPGCPRTHLSEDQASLELRSPPALASLGLKAWATTTGHVFSFLTLTATSTANMLEFKTTSFLQRTKITFLSCFPDSK